MLGRARSLFACDFLLFIFIVNVMIEFCIYAKIFKVSQCDTDCWLAYKLHIVPQEKRKSLITSLRIFKTVVLCRILSQNTSINKSL